MVVKQTEAQALGRKGERWFQYLLPKEWLFERPSEDIGLDGTVIIGSPRETGGFEFRVQIKASAKWVTTGNRTSVPGIKRETLAYWTSRLTPTMLVLYDAENDVGLYAWTGDILPDPVAFFRSKATTVTLHVPTASQLNDASWEAIRLAVEGYYSKLVASLSALSVVKASVGVMASLASSLRLLLLSLHRSSPVSEQDQMLLDLGAVLAHRDVVLALSRLSRGPLQGTALASFATGASAAYRSEIEQFVNGFDSVLEQGGSPVAVWINPDKLEESRPRLMIIITEMMRTIARSAGADEE